MKTVEDMSGSFISACMAADEAINPFLDKAKTNMGRAQIERAVGISSLVGMCASLINAMEERSGCALTQEQIEGLMGIAINQIKAEVLSFVLKGEAANRRKETLQ